MNKCNICSNLYVYKRTKWLTNLIRRDFAWLLFQHVSKTKKEKRKHVNIKTIYKKGLPLWKWAKISFLGICLHRAFVVWKVRKRICFLNPLDVWHKQLLFHRFWGTRSSFGEKFSGPLMCCGDWNRNHWKCRAEPSGVMVECKESNHHNTIKCLRRIAAAVESSTQGTKRNTWALILLKKLIVKRCSCRKKLWTP